MNIQKKYVSKIQNKFFYGWLIVLISALTAFFSAPGQTYFISGFIEFYIEAFDLTRTTVSQYYSLATLSAGLMLPFVGRFIDNHGERRLTLVIATLLSLVCIFTGLMFSPFLLIISFFLLRLLGQGSMTLLSNVVVPKWFYKKRGFALSMITVGSVVGSIFIPPLNTLISLKFGWRMSWYIWSALIAFIFIPIVYLFLINKPEDVGLLIDDEGVEDQERNKIVHALRYQWSLSEALKTKSFWLMAMASSMPALINTGLFFHLYSIIELKGMPITMAALILSLYGGLSFAFSLISGYVADRVNPRYLIFGSFIYQVINILLLNYMTSPILSIVFGINMGIIAGIQGVSFRTIWPNYFGKENLASISSFRMTMMVIASSISPLLIGVLYDRFKGYTEALILMAFIAGLAGLLAIVAKKPKAPEAI
jgi:MFS family permease